MESTIENYLSDVLRLLIERAKEAKNECHAAKMTGSKNEQLFQEGRALAYYEVISTLLNEASAFGLSQERIPELQFDVDKELLSCPTDEPQ